MALTEEQIKFLHPRKIKVDGELIDRCFRLIDYRRYITDDEIESLLTAYYNIPNEVLLEFIDLVDWDDLFEFNTLDPIMIDAYVKKLREEKSAREATTASSSISGNSTTGFFIGTGGSSRLHISSNGTAGLGTTHPSTSLSPTLSLPYITTHSNIKLIETQSLSEDVLMDLIEGELLDPQQVAGLIMHQGVSGAFIDELILKNIVKPINATK